MIIDFHTHAFPDKIAERAMGILSKNSGNVVPCYDGTIKGLKQYLKEKNVDKAVVLNIATNEKQQKNVNDFAISVNDDTVISFGSVHPRAADALEELERIKEAGLKGIKLHPDYQDFFVDDETVFPIYEKAAELGLITVFHAGIDIEYFEPCHCTPERFSRALPAFNGGKVVLAHFGGMLKWYEVEEHLVGKDLYIDTSYAYGRMPRQQAKRIVQNHGAEKMLFGSDMPWSGAEYERLFIKALDLSKEEEDLIFYKNAQRILDIKE